jgi:hypothetical protein
LACCFVRSFRLLARPKRHVYMPPVAAYHVRKPTPAVVLISVDRHTVGRELGTIGKDERWLHQWIKDEREGTEEDPN